MATLVSPNRLVLDFPGAIYDQATKYIDVGIGSVKQIRVGQFSTKPPVVRVVIEMKRALRYRVLKQGEGEKYYVQLYSKERRKAVIMLDAGHGGSDTGAIGVTGVYEKDITLPVTLALADSLRNLGYEVELTRDTDRFASLGERADRANELLPMIFVSIHANSIEDPAFSGVMTFHFNGASEASALADSIQRQLLASTGAVDRGVRTANFFVLRETVVPAVLVEIGFLTLVSNDADTAASHGFASLNVLGGFLTAEDVIAIQDLGLDVSVWTIDDPDLMADLASYGISMLITDDPDVFAQVRVEACRATCGE